MSYDNEMKLLEAAHRRAVSDQNRCYQRITMIDKNCDRLRKEMLALDAKELKRIREIEA